MQKDWRYLFTLRVATSQGMVIINAWEGEHTYGTTHTRIDVEVRLKGATVFPRGALWCGIPAHQSIDGIDAKECVLALVAMKPGDTDADYFAEYTPEQLAFAELLGEELSMVRDWRYCDRETGEVR